jgi:alpha-glucosidase (family GH31 glycosyl hydrolase)
MKEFNGNNNINLKVYAFSNGIVRLQYGGYDGYIDSLLNRYNFIDKLTAVDGKWADNSLLLSDGCNLNIDAGLGFSVIRDGDELLSTQSGWQPATAPTVYQNKGYHLRLSGQENEKYIGFGDIERKKFLLNGKADSLWIRNQVSYVPVPFFMSSNGYGILFNTTRRLFFDFGAKEAGVNSFSVEKDFLDIYIITGNNFLEIIEKYCDLTGRPALPPRFTFGLWMTVNSEIRSHELLQLALQFRNEEIPCDLLALEPLWMETLYDETVDKKWDQERFPYYPWADKSPSTFIGNLKSMGYHFGLWMCSNYDHTWEEERKISGNTLDVKANDSDFLSAENMELVEQDDHFGHQPMLMDKVTVPEEPFFEHLKKFVDQGVDYFKQDGYAQINLHTDRLHGNGLHDDVMHNIHYQIYTRQMLEGFENHTGRRGFTLAVSGWAGFQKFSGTWTGDTGGGAETMVAMLQCSLFGHSFSTCDIDVDDICSIHMGFLLPWSQINSWAYYKYPIYRKKELRRIFQEYSNLRMKFLPYIYTQAWKASSKSMPMMRPMFLDYPDREEAFNITTQYFLGDSLLVSSFSSDVVLPEGRWFDLWTGKIHEGKWISETVDIPADRGGHLFLKEGGIVPRGPVMQHVDEVTLTEVHWLVYPSGSTVHGELYLDDGYSFDYKKDDFAVFTLSSEQQEGSFRLTISQDGSYKHSVTSHNIEIIGCKNCEVRVNGNSVETEQGEYGRVVRNVSVSDKIEF